MRNRPSPRHLVLPLLVAALIDCAERRADPPPSITPLTAPSAPAAPPFTPITRASGATQGSTIALGTLAGKRLAFVADADARAIRAIDRDTRQELAPTLLESTPSQLVIAADGRLYVALRDQDAVAVLEPTGAPDAPLAVRARLPTATEPVALALTPDERTLLVTSGWGHRLAAIALDTRRERWSLDLPREPRAVTTSADGDRVFVAHMVGSVLSVIQLAGDEAKIEPPLSLAGSDYSLFADCMSDTTIRHKRFTDQGFAIARLGHQVFAPEVLVHSEAGEPMGGYGSNSESFRVVEPAVAVIDATSSAGTLRVDDGAFALKASRTRTSSTPPLPRPEPCLLPRAIVADDARAAVLVACAGIDRVIAVSAAGGRLDRSELARFQVGAGPSGLAIDATANQALSFAQFDRRIDVLTLPAPGAPPAPALQKPALSIPLPPLPGETLSAAIREGRRLFHAVGDPRISSDGRVCASCHPDGRDDGLVWSTPEGRLQTPMLAGRLDGTAPYGWSGNGKTLEDHLKDTFKRLGGKGLKGAELAALIAYASALPTPARPPPADPRVARGREIFGSVETMCSICHTESRGFTDGSVHEVGSGATLDTPSLRFVVGTAPYFHDGRYATLRDLLVGTNGKMGQTKHLAEEDLSALEAYLRTL